MESDYVIKSRILPQENFRCYPWVAFFEAAADGDVNTIQSLLESKSVNVDETDVDGFTALMIASAEGQDDVVRVLLENSADVNMKTIELRSIALHFAAKNGNPSIVSRLCKANPDSVNTANVNADTPLVWACIEGKDAAVKELLQHGSTVDITNHYGATTLMCATMIGENSNESTDEARASIVRMLLQKEPNLVNRQDQDGTTSMHLAASCGYIQCVKALLDGKADITIRNAIGETPLEEAEDTGFAGSEVCVDHLRVKWKMLEEEAASRMLSILIEEMEEDRSSSSASNAHSHEDPTGKATKRKSRRSKRGKKSTSATPTGTGQQDKQKSDTVPESEIQGMLPTADEEKEVQNTDVKDQSLKAPTPSGIPIIDEDEGDWTTVNRKNRVQQLSQATERSTEKYPPPPVNEENFKGKSKTVIPTSVGLHENTSTIGGQKDEAVPISCTLLDQAGKTDSKEGNCTEVVHIKVPDSKESETPEVVQMKDIKEDLKPDISRKINSNDIKGGLMYPGAAASSAVDQLFQASEASGMDQVAKRLEFLRSPLTSSVLSSTSMTIPSSPLGPTSNSKIQFSTSSSLFHPSPSMGPFPEQRAYLNVAMQLNESTPIRRPRASQAIKLRNNINSIQRSQPNNAPSSVSTLNSNSVSEVNPTWIQQIRNHSVQEAMSLLLCGICRELISNNLECPTNLCGQLFCKLCLQSNLSSSGFACTKCNTFISSIDECTYNNFAQKQAACIGLHSATDEIPLDDIQKNLFITCPRAEAVAISPVHLVPGFQLSELSMGQLDVLEDVHHQALRAISDAKMDHMRLQERMQLQEQLKTQRDIYCLSDTSILSSTDFFE